MSGLKEGSLKLLLLVLITPLFYSCVDEVPSTVVPIFEEPEVEPSSNYLNIYAGHSHTCALTNAQELKCWGNNSHGQLGDGTTVDQTKPKTIDTGVAYQHVSVGEFHTCGITTSNQLKCWGYNNLGQLGTGNEDDVSTPTIIDTGNTYSWVSVSGYTSCGLRSSGQILCWGNNQYGQLGIGTLISKNSPTAINDATLYKSVSVGALYTCGITTTDFVKCWGNNDFGQLGDGTQDMRMNPKAIDVTTTYRQIATSEINSSYTCGLTTSDDLKCWGDNRYGQLGTNNTTSQLAPVGVMTAQKFNSISVGYVHTCAQEKANGTLYCWGKNEYGQIGDRTLTDKLLPQEGDYTIKYSKISAGYNYTCGITVKNKMRCWGRNDFGQIGRGDLIDQITPIYIE